MLKEILEYVEKNGGITYNFQEGHLQNSGFAVGIYPNRERTLTFLDDRRLIHFIHENYDLLANENNCIGIWWNKGYYVLDISTVVFREELALQIAKDNEQLAIYDLANNKTVYLYR